MYQVQICTIGAVLFGKSLVIKLNYIVIFGMHHHYPVIPCHLFHCKLNPAKVQSQARAFRVRWQHVSSKDFETGKSLLDKIAKLVKYSKWHSPHQSHME